MGKILAIFSDLILIENILKLKIFSIFYSFSFIPIIYYSFLDFYTVFSFIFTKNINNFIYFFKYKQY